jgi:hypothetical protein
MSITMAQLKKNLKTLDERVDRLSKAEAFIDGAVEPKVEQLQTKSGSGTSGDVPKHTMTEGTFVDGTQKDVERAMPQKDGSGATVSEEYANITHQTGKHFNDGAVDKEEMQKCPAGKKGTPMRGKKSSGTGPKNPADRASAAKVPKPSGGLPSKSKK